MARRLAPRTPSRRDRRAAARLTKKTSVSSSCGGQWIAPRSRNAPSAAGDRPDAEAVGVHNSPSGGSGRAIRLALPPARVPGTAVLPASISRRKAALSPMPTYEYRCPNGHTFELFQRMSDPSPSECQICGAAPVEKVLYPAAIHFKGSGFYSTDYGRGGRKKDRRPRRREVGLAGRRSKAADKSRKESSEATEAGARPSRTTCPTRAAGPERARSRAAAAGAPSCP